MISVFPDGAPVPMKVGTITKEEWEEEGTVTMGMAVILMGYVFVDFSLFFFFL